MNNKKFTDTKTGKIIYWIATIWLSLGMVSTGLMQLMKKNGQGGIDMLIHLGYPVYLLMILGVWKILGVTAVLVPGIPVVKEWAYAGFFFIMTGAFFSHLAIHDSAIELLPSVLLLILTIISWYFRPTGRRVVLAN
jgi:uncharacterized membrane protein YphA (DoxX/SURF4 family)